MSTKSQSNDNTNMDECQAVIGVLGTLEEHYEVRDKVMQQLMLAGNKIGYKHQWCKRMEECGSYMETSQNGSPLNANFCRERFCPVCQWKRSIKLWHETMEIMKILDGKYDCVFLTLTQKNIPFYKLNDEMNNLREKWKLFRQSKLMRNARGFIRNLEITINHEEQEFHPHQHIIIAFDKGYYKNDQYITHEEYLNQWKKTYKGKVSSVDIKAIKKDNLEKSVAEIVKYAVKINDLSTYEDIDILADLMKGLKGKRLINYSGIFKKAKQQLQKYENTENEYYKSYYRGYDNKYYEFENEFPRSKMVTKMNLLTLLKNK